MLLGRAKMALQWTILAMECAVCSVYNVSWKFLRNFFPKITSLICEAGMFLLLACSRVTRKYGHDRYLGNPTTRDNNSDGPAALIDSSLNWSSLGKTFPTKVSYQSLTPFTLGSGLVLRNRVVRAAAFAGADIETLISTHAEVARYSAETCGLTGKGGVAMTTVAYAAVSKNGQTFLSQLVLDDSAQLSDLRRLTSAVHAAGAAICVQLTHAGAFADRTVSGRQQVAPSGNVFNPAGFDWPREMDACDMHRVQDEFVYAALLAKSAGFDAVELHCGHGYLLSQFLCPFTNARTDEYGGDVINRLRFPLRVLDKIRSAVGKSFTIVVKMNVTDALPRMYNMSLEDAIACAQAFETHGADALVLSGGTVTRSGFGMLHGDVPLVDMVRATPSWPKKAALLCFGWAYVPLVPFHEAFFRGYARAVLRAVTSIPVCLLGGITLPATIEGALDEGFAFVQMARALIRNPNFVQDVMDQRNADVNGLEPPGGKLCTHCNVCVVSTLDPSKPMRCVERIHDSIGDVEDIRIHRI